MGGEGESEPLARRGFSAEPEREAQLMAPRGQGLAVRWQVIGRGAGTLGNGHEEIKREREYIS